MEDREELSLHEAASKPKPAARAADLVVPLKAVDAVDSAVEAASWIGDSHLT